MRPPPAMPTPVAEVFHLLQNELLDIHVKWSQYMQLFGTSPERIDLLNSFAPVFFGYVERIMYDDLVLSLFRFTDSLATGHKANLTLDRLASTVKADHAVFGQSVQAEVERIDALLEPHANWRNHRVAHNDLTARQALWGGTSTLTGPSREQVEDMLERMHRLMNQVAIHYGDDPMAYDALLLPTPGDAQTLVFYLEDWLQGRGIDRGQR